MQLGLIAAGAIGLAAALFALTPFQGQVDFVVVAFVIFLVAQTATSHRVEGARAARNRLALTLLVTTVFVALVPLVALFLYTIKRGLEAISPGFFTHSMRGV